MTTNPRSITLLLLSCVFFLALHFEYPSLNGKTNFNKEIINVAADPIWPTSETSII